MSTLRFLPEGDMASWLAGIAGSRRVLAPRREGKSIVFRPLNAGEKPVLERATIAPKAAVFPPCETLITYKGVKDPENPARVSLSLDDTPGDVCDQLLFGCRSCDTRGLLYLDHAFMKGKFCDPYYKARRDRLLVFTQTCDAPCPSCFCHWVGGGPACPEGSDVLMTAVEGGLLLESVSEQGESFLKDTSLPDGADKMAEATARREKAASLLEPAPDISAAPKRLEERFNDMKFWTDQTAKCISCGACTYMCPTCQCFTITDEGDSLNGRRLRSWDNCMSSLFTREASGHNPRTEKAARMRNRVSHKYWYAPGYYHGQQSCTGCGRCVRQCPASLDIREIVLKAIAADA